jgi:hypothetical protein
MQPCIEADVQCCLISAEKSKESKRVGAQIMARPIEATPVLKGKDARAFLDQIRIDGPISAQRIQWLEKLARESKTSEK